MGSLLLPRSWVAQDAAGMVSGFKLIARNEAILRIVAGMSMIGMVAANRATLSYGRCVIWSLTGALILNTGIFFQ